MSQSYSVVKTSSIADVKATHLNDCDKENDVIHGYETNGGILSNTKYIWKSYGPKFTVIDSKTGMKISAWTFGSVVKDSSVKVSCLDELPRATGKPPFLVIGLECEINKGMICVFDISGSRVLRAIQLLDKVTSIHVIGVGNDRCPLPGPLRAFDGVVAVGTAGGHVLLLDLCRQSFEEGFSEIKDEVKACQVKYLLMDEIYSLELHKQVVSRVGDHLAIHINSTYNTPYFILKGPKGEDRVHVNKMEVLVSALHYCPQLHSLLIGYNFGAWQLWNLRNLQLTYTSPVYEENIPVTHFCLQEPCDDPRAFCYIWAVYSNTEFNQTGYPVAVLYSLNYNSKEWHEGYGILYEDLVSCSVRFQTDLTLLGKSLAENTPQGAQCLRLQAINKSTSKSGCLEDNQEEIVNLCYIVWSGWSSNLPCVTYLSLFDLNQWYKEQMPYSPRFKEQEGYITCVCLNDILESSHDSNLKNTRFLDVRIDTNTLSQFFGSQKLEEHYYPSSLAFQLCALSENNVVTFSNQGSQRALLSHLESSGPMVLLKPTELAHQAISLGLCPLFFDVSNIASMALENQRELLLNIALEHQLLGWLCRCASSWSSGSFSTIGCNLHSLLAWGWNRSRILKENADGTTVPLFDYSGLRLDTNSHNLLNSCVKQLKGLSMLFGYVSQKLLNFVYNPETIRKQWKSLQMISLHMEVLQWLLNVGLLPECPLSSYPRPDEYERISAPYPVDELVKYYNERRATLQSLNKEQFSTSGSLLFIDNLIDLECGGYQLRKQWENDGGNGLYPPPSLQSLLRTYLTENVQMSFKHSVVVYVFLDLATILNKTSYKPIITHLIKFPAVFQLSPSLIKITQAFWQLDHGDFSTAMEQLLDPLVCTEDLKLWHHRIALNALLAQEQHKFALLYLQVRQPAISDVHDLCTILSLYVANNMLEEAFHFERQNNSSETEEKLLQHFYKECDRKEKIFSVLHLPLASNEENILMKYLKDVKHPQLEDLQTFYYIQHSRLVDAVEVNDTFSSTSSISKGLKGQKNAPLREFVVNGIFESLPDVSKNLMRLCKQEKNNLWLQVERPEPFSVLVHGGNDSVKYKSSIIHAGLVKSKEIWSHPVLDRTLNNSRNITTEDIPFLNTPKANLSKPRLTTSVIYPKIIKDDEDEDGPSPRKIFKPSPRSPALQKAKQKQTTPTKTDTDVKFDTPLIKRKTPKGSRVSDEKFTMETPQSILKIRNLARNSESPDPIRMGDSPETVKNLNVPTGSLSTPPPADSVVDGIRPLSRRSIGVTPRKPLPRTPKPAVHFDFSDSSMDSVTNEPAKQSKQNVNESRELSVSNSKNSTATTEDTFYSPETSPVNLNSDFNKVDKIEETERTITSSNYNQSPKTRRSYRDRGERSTSLETSLNEMEPPSPPSKSSVKQTPKSRRSYKDLSQEVPVRSSPRLRKSLFVESAAKQTDDPGTQLQNTSIKQALRSHTPQSSPSESSPKKSKLKPRKSLSRKVLENNTFTKMSDDLVTQKIETTCTIESFTTRTSGSFSSTLSLSPDSDSSDIEIVPEPISSLKPFLNFESNENVETVAEVVKNGDPKTNTSTPLEHVDASNEGGANDQFSEPMEICVEAVETFETKRDDDLTGINSSRLDKETVATDKEPEVSEIEKDETVVDNAKDSTSPANESGEEKLIVAGKPKHTEADEPAVTKTPTEAERPVETEKPTEAEKPTETGKSTETEKRTETEKLTENEKPVETPTKTQQPTETESPTETTKPTETEIPTETEKPTETEMLTESEKPTQTKQLASSEKLSADENLTTAEDLTETQKPTEASSTDDRISELKQPSSPVLTFSLSDSEDFDDEVDLNNALQDDDVQYSTEVIEDDDAEKIYEDLSNDNYVHTDPQMNIFEMNAELDLNDGMYIEKSENILEMDTNYTNTDGDMFENAQILSNVLSVDEESYESDPNTPINELERNIGAASSSSHPYSDATRNEEVEIIELSSGDDQGDDNNSEYGSKISYNVTESEDESNSRDSNRSRSYDSNNSSEADAGVASDEDKRFKYSDSENSSSDGSVHRTRYGHVVIREIPDDEDESLGKSHLETILEEPDEGAVLNTSPSATTDLPQQSEEIEPTEQPRKDYRKSYAAEELSDSDIMDKTVQCPKIVVSQDLLDESQPRCRSHKILDCTDVLDATPSRCDPNDDMNVTDVAVGGDEFESNVPVSGIPARRALRSTSLKLPSTESTPVRRSQRRCSLSETPQQQQTTAVTETSVSATVKRRGSSLLSETSKKSDDSSIEAKKIPAKRSLRSVSVDADTVKKLTRTTRANSESRQFDADEIISISGTSTRSSKSKSNSTKADTKKASGATVSRSGSVSLESQPEKRARTTRSKSREVDDAKISIEEYSTSRRLTRRQANLLEQTLNSSSGNPKDSEKLPGKNAEDKIQPDQPETLETSPASGEAQAVPKRSKKVGPVKRASTDISEGVSSRTRQRSKSTDESFIHMESSPPKLRRTRKNSTDSDVSNISQTHSLADPKELRNTRLRPRAISLTEERESPRKTRSTRRTVVAKPKLTHINEEQTIKEDESAATTKNLRKKSGK